MLARAWRGAVAVTVVVGRVPSTAVLPLLVAASLARAEGAEVANKDDAAEVAEGPEGAGVSTWASAFADPDSEASQQAWNAASANGCCVTGAFKGAWPFR
jgi:hypothetical protein